jgi:hypothetical protein
MLNKVYPLLMLPRVSVTNRHQGGHYRSCNRVYLTFCPVLNTRFTKTFQNTIFISVRTQL